MLADPEFTTPAEVDLLFGAGICAKIVGARMFRSSLGTVLQQTELGLIVMGEFEMQQENLNNARSSAI